MTEECGVGVQVCVSMCVCGSVMVGEFLLDQPKVLTLHRRPQSWHSGGGSVPQGQ